jgi:sigma-E factor negative regulatory protein RseB
VRTRAALAGALALLGGGVLAAGLAHATAPSGAPQPWTAATLPSAPRTVPSDEEALAIVRRAATAASTTSYQGTASVVAADSGAVSRVWIAHVPGRGTLLRPADGTPTTPTTLGPDAGPGGLAPDGGDVALLSQGRSLRLVGRDDVAGRPADVVLASLPSGAVAARLWFDRGTGLLVRREVYDLAGQRAGSATFLTFATPAGVDVPQGGAAALRPAVGPEALERLRTEGWRCPPALPAGMLLVQAREAAGGAVALEYSDGLSSVSLFEQRGELDQEALTGFDRRDVGGALVLRRAGTPAVWVWQSQGSVFTLVADVGAPAVARVVAALPPDGTQADDGLVERMSPGLGDLARGVGDALARSGS